MCLWFSHLYSGSDKRAYFTELKTERISRAKSIPPRSCLLRFLLLLTLGNSNAGDMRDTGSIPGSGRSPGRGHGNPVQHSSLEIPWTEEPGGLQSMGSQRVGHDWSALALHNPGNSHCICSCSSQLTNPWEVSYFTRMHFYGFFCLGKWMCNKWLRQWGNFLQCRRPRLDLWVRKIPWWKEWQPLQYSWTEEPGRLQSMGLQRVGQDWATNTSTFFVLYYKLITKRMLSVA